MNLPNFKAGGDVNRSRFVKISDSHEVTQAGVGDEPFAISQRGIRDTPLPGASTLAAADDNTIQIYGPGDMCSLEAGEAVSAGAFIKPGVAGVGMNVEGGEQYYAQALTPALAAGDKFDVFLVRGVSRTPTASKAAAGSTQADATLLALNSNNTVSGADGTKGARLPPAVAGCFCNVYNEHASNGLKIYPASGDDINDGTADAAITIEGKTVATMRCLDGATWAAAFTVNS